MSDYGKELHRVRMSMAELQKLFDAVTNNQWVVLRRGTMQYEVMQDLRLSGTTQSICMGAGMTVTEALQDAVARQEERERLLRCPECYHKHSSGQVCGAPTIPTCVCTVGNALYKP